MNKKEFNQWVTFLANNFNFKIESGQYIEFLYQKLSQFSSEQFVKATNKILQISQQEWVNKYGFGGKPNIADLEAFFIDKPRISLRDQAIIEVNKLVDYAKHCFDTEVITDNPYLNQTIHDYGGIRKLCWELDSYNNEKREEAWIKRDLIEIYMGNAEANRGCMKPSIKEEPKKDYFGRQITQARRGFIGNKEKIQEMLEIEAPTQEGEPRKKLDISKQVIENLAKQLKKI
jgi:hypothetical protein